MNFLVTGSAGFIAHHLIRRLLETDKNQVFGIDNLNDYYSIQLKLDRNNILQKYSNYHFFSGDIVNVNEIFGSLKSQIDMIIHLGAQAGVRYSIENPKAYFESNLRGQFEILELAREIEVPLIYASSSSVYGDHVLELTSEHDESSKPISFYGATKKSGEVLAESYFKSFKLISTGLRFFTVYGPFGRPDMAYWKFTKNITEGNLIDVYNDGEMYRDFTYIDDIVSGIISSIKFTLNSERHEIINLGNNRPIKLMNFITILEDILQKKAKIRYLPKPSGDVFKTSSDISKAKTLLNFKPATNIEEGLRLFCNWYASYFSFK